MIFIGLGGFHDEKIVLASIFSFLQDTGRLLLLRSYRYHLPKLGFIVTAIFFAGVKEVLMDARVAGILN